MERYSKADKKFSINSPHEEEMVPRFYHFSFSIGSFNGKQ